MLQIHNFKLIFTSTANPSSIFLPFKFSFSSSFLWKPYSTQKLFSPLTVVSASFDPKRRNFTQIRRNNTFGDTKKGEKTTTTMEEKENFGFNKRRAEGRDKGKPKALQLKTRKLNPVNTICYLQILGTGMDTQDTSPSVLLFFDKQRFIFNSGEGLQRFCTEHKIKLSKIDHIFLSRVCSETAGGLPGLLLTLAGMGDEGMTVNIWGPSDIKYLIDAMKSFIPNAAMVHTHRFGPTEGSMGSFFTYPNPDITNPIVLVNDEVVKISAILLRPSFSVKSKYTEKGTTVGNMKNESLEENGGTFSCPPENVSVVYICELPEIKGKFDPAKAVALGLKAGPKYRELQLGNSVMSDKQNIMIHPTDVLGPSIPGPIVILVDCPTPSHFHQLMSVTSLNSFYANSLDENQDDVKKVHCLIHLGPASVTSTFDYRNWMTRFGQTQHIMAGHERKNIEVPILKSSARIASRLNFLCPQIFPASGFWSVPENMPLNTAISTEKSTSVAYDVILAENLLKFHLRPYAQLGLDKTGIPSLLTPKGIVNELLSEIPEIEDVSTHMKQLWDSSGRTKPMLSRCDKLIMIEEPWMDSNKQTDVSIKGNGTRIIMSDTDLPSCLEDITRENMEIVLLGTGSSQPSKYRNVSSIYLNLFSKGGIILDCGEGTLGQLKRRFGVNGADEVVKNLRFIWISHIHADHHTGLARILSLRRELLRDVTHDPLLVIGPRQLKRFLDAYSRLEDLDMQFLDCKHTTQNSLEALKDIFESNSNQELSDDSVNNQRVVSLNTEHTLFAGGRKMESCWRKPGIVMDPADYNVLGKLNTLLNETGMDSLISVPVVHCPQAYGIVLKASERQNRLGKKIPGWKLVYSGDTRPCQSLIDASCGATVLIHEATFEDSLLDEAIAKNHSTTKEAVEVGDSSGAYRTILTHFSQRYPKIPVFDETHMHNTCIGFDLMSINIADLPILPEVNPCLKLLFKDEMARDESEDQPVLEAEI